ncbi:cytochrome P450, family 82, subfamily C, polypeptide 4 [Hibiscus trionum]|uniref:Cytochrome P450, family 82, subfamily C, polypeptide 4 n=1 Tax=Hibiscus trionum TaxID=183268 RepID=A0A9W7HIM8_HIBTR|nr:cytochrome P450, family 82, subfamily C, polypeptide 4 [Hibiscus trionum]
MDSVSFYSVTATSTIAIICVPLLLFLFSFLWVSKAISKTTNQKRTAPEAGGAWPVIGHLRLLGGPQPPHMSLANMADKYGAIFTIKLGVHRALVVSSSEVAKECLTINDKAFATRPKLVSTQILGYNNTLIGFAPYGPYWRQVRKFITIELLSNHRLGSLKHVQESEIKLSLQQLYELWNMKRSSNIDKVLVEMKTWFKDVTLNVILKIIVGKRITGSNESDGETVKWKKAMDDIFEISGKFKISDVLPFLRWLDIGGEEKFMRKIAEELDRVVEGWLREHKEKRVQDEANSEKDFMGVMLSRLRDAEEHEADTINKATSLALILAGEDTTSVTLTWALSLLLNNRDALSKIQQELNVQVGHDKLFVTESDTKSLVYLQAVIKETLRLYPPAPLSVLHEAIEDCTVNGYHVLTGTWLILNLKKIQRDPRVWENPSEFRPERFMTTHKDFDVRGQNFELIPFGSGRRMCPGVSLALQILQLTLANLLHWFEFKTPSDETIDMREAMGITSSKATPLEVHITPRLPAFVYDSTS